jgi:trehalose-6-phosphate synthase
MAVLVSPFPCPSVPIEYDSNSPIGSADFVPIHFLYKSVNFTELVALYALADVAIVSSTRDGMNLVGMLEC